MNTKEQSLLLISNVVDRYYNVKDIYKFGQHENLTKSLSRILRKSETQDFEYLLNTFAEKAKSHSQLGGKLLTRIILGRLEKMLKKGEKTNE